METNENEDTTVQNFWNTAKAVLRGKYIAIQVSLKKLEKTQIHKLTSHLKELEKTANKNYTKQKKRVNKVRTELNERTVEQINKTKSWFFERMN